MFRSTLAKLFPARRTGSSRRSPFSPRLEALDSRLVPTTVTSDATFYYVDGDYWANDSLVVIAHGGGGFTVTDAAGLGFTIPAGKELKVRTHFGNDVVRYATDGTFSGTDSRVSVDLGEGNDRFTGTLNRDLTNGTFLKVDVRGTGGNDLITLYGTPTAPTRANDHLTDGLAINTGGMSISATSELQAYLDGGGGDDRILFDYEGDLDGEVHLLAEGRDGNDEVGADLTLNGSSTGLLDAWVEGDGGSDILRLRVFDFSGGNVDVDADIYGDDDLAMWPDYLSNDEAFHTGNVTVYRCEIVH